MACLCGLGGIMYDNYAKLRNKLGLNDGKVAQMTGVSRSVFTRWKNGQSSPSGSTRKKICKALGIEPTMYFDEQTTIKPKSNTRTLDQDDLVPCDIEITVDGQKFMIEQKDYAELQRGISAYILAWIKANKK